MDKSVQPAIADWITQLSQLAAEITHRATQLQRDVYGGPSDLVPKLVSGASQIEAALADLLSYSRFAHQASPGLPATDVVGFMPTIAESPTVD
jgi:hypothetical protein